MTDPHAPLKFGENNIVIPITVLEELDKFKRNNDTLGQTAREATRLIDRCRTKGGLSISVERFKDQPLTGHCNLTQGERSSLAELASNLLWSLLSKTTPVGVKFE